MKVKQDKIRDIIGQGGKTIRGIQSDCGVKISVEDTGIVTIASSDGESLQKAKDIINRLTEEVEVGKVYMGTVRKIMDFGAFVEVLPGTDGLVHISQLAHHRVKAVPTKVAEGDQNPRESAGDRQARQDQAQPEKNDSCSDRKRCQRVGGWITFIASSSSRTGFAWSPSESRPSNLSRLVFGSTPVPVTKTRPKPDTRTSLNICSSKGRHAIGHGHLP